MLTFVVNLHSGIPGMALAEPLLYPLMKAEKLNLIFQAADSVSERLEGAAMRVRRHLERSSYTKWQVVFLVKIDAAQRNPFRESLSAQMALIRHLFLGNPSINLKPTQVFLVAIDHINEDEAIPAIQVSEAYRDSWELDNTGFIRNPKRFFVTETHLQELDKTWNEKVRQHLRGSEVLNMGFDRLSAELQQSVQAACAQIKDRVGQVLDPKAIDFATYQIDRDTPYIDESALTLIKEAFLARLEATRVDATRYADFLPSSAFRLSLSERVGIFSEENQAIFRVLRFPMSYSHEDILQQYLIKLAVLLGMIANEEDCIRGLAKKNYTVAAELNEPELRQVIYNYLEHLHNTEKRFGARLNVQQSVQLMQLENRDCSCNATLEKTPPPLINLGFLRKNGDFHIWDSWNEQIDTHLQEYSLQARRKMQTCIDENQQRQSDPALVEEAKIDEKTDDLERTKTALQGQVEHSFLSTSFAFDWHKYQAEQEATLKPKLLSRPSNNEIAILLLVTTLIMTIPFANIRIKYIEIEFKLFYYGLIALINLSLVYLAYYLSKKYYSHSLKIMLQTVYDKARDLRLNIYDDFERQKEYLKSLCKLNIVRYNYEQASDARRRRNDANLLLDYHRRKLNEHKDYARKILRIFGGTEDSMTSTMQLDESALDLKVDTPVYENAVYTPVTFMINRAQQEGLQVVKIENVPTITLNPLGRLLNSISFDRDKIYKGK